MLYASDPTLADGSWTLSTPAAPAASQGGRAKKGKSPFRKFRKLFSSSSSSTSSNSNASSSMSSGGSSALGPGNSPYLGVTRRLPRGRRRRSNSPDSHPLDPTRLNHNPLYEVILYDILTECLGNTTRGRLYYV